MARIAVDAWAKSCRYNGQKRSAMCLPIPTEMIMPSILRLRMPCEAGDAGDSDLIFLMANKKISRSVAVGWISLGMYAMLPFYL
jgi:hypothetical protein